MYEDICIGIIYLNVFKLIYLLNCEKENVLYSCSGFKENSANRLNV